MTARLPKWVYKVAVEVVNAKHGIGDDVWSNLEAGEEVYNPDDIGELVEEPAESWRDRES